MRTAASHPVVGRTAAPFRHHPVDVLARVLDVARLAVDAVLGVDLQSHPIARFQGDVLVNTWEEEDALLLWRGEKKGESQCL